MKLKLYIDTAYVWNKYGVEYIGIYHEYWSGLLKKIEFKYSNINI